MEQYYQESGRAGRDGDPAECELLFAVSDVQRARFFISSIKDEGERARAMRSLSRITSYASTVACRKAQILNYFGESREAQGCGSCDVCSGEVRLTNATRDAQIVLSAVYRTGQRFGAGHVTDVVRGKRTDKVVRAGHEKVQTFGVGSSRGIRYWRRVIDELLMQGYLEQTGDRYPVLRLSESSRDVLSGGRDVHVSEYTANTEEDHRARPAASRIARPADQELFEHLRDMRRRIASQSGLPAYMILTDRTLREIATVKPHTLQTLSNIHGVGTVKLDKYGTAILEAVAQHDART
jgi:ATP-dependent DNA helicase RecQ